MSNFQNINDEEIEQDELKEKLDLITITSAKNLDAMQTAVDMNTTVNTTHTAFFDMESGANNTFRTYAETTRSSLNSLTSTVNTHETEINALQSSTALFTDGIKFTFNGAYALDGSNNLTGSLLSVTNALTSGFRRYVLVRTDTYSSDVTLSDSNTKFTISETGYYLSIMSYEIYDNSADTKTIELEFKGDTEGSLQMARNTVTGTSTNYEYERVTNTMIVYLTSGNLYSYQGKSSNGGVINAYNTVTNMTLLKISKSF
jgi:hypothetical protein